MNAILEMIVLLCLVLIFFQDWRKREIHIVLPVLVFIFGSWLGLKQNKIVLAEIFYNAAFFLLILSILIIYMSIKYKRFLNPFHNYFGLGDLLFYLSVTPLFLLRNYILFFILSMFFAIVLQLLLRKKMQQNTVPLAGFSSLFLMLLILKDLLSIPFERITLV